MPASASRLESQLNQTRSLLRVSSRKKGCPFFAVEARKPPDSFRIVNEGRVFASLRPLATRLDPGYTPPMLALRGFEGQARPVRMVGRSALVVSSDGGAWGSAGNGRRSAREGNHGDRRQSG